MFYSKKLKAFEKIQHCFFSKKNGFSKGIYKSLNCGKGSNDDQKLIVKNLRVVTESMNVANENLILMHQSHSNNVIVIDKKNKNNKEFKSDALITQIKGLVLGVLTADCVPIILYDQNSETVACIHAGWKGCLSGVIENTLSKLKAINLNNNIIACVGPCIGKNNYETDLDFFNIFEKKSNFNSSFFTKKNDKKYFFDIRGFVNNKLKILGVNYIDNLEMDTFQDSDNFFSYRRSRKLRENDYGRCISVIALK
jgi:YfiH family protein